MEALPIDIAKIRLTEFFPTEFAVRGNATGQQLAENGIATQFRLTQDLDFTANPALNRVGVQVRIGVETVMGDPAEPVGSGGTFVLDFGFVVDNLPDLMVDIPPGAGDALEAVTAQVPAPPLLVLLTSIAYSTARGVLWGRLAGTALEGFTLPVVDVNRLLSDVAQAKAGLG